MPSVQPFEKNIARLMVRRHLGTWVKSKVISEELLLAMFLRSMRSHPDWQMSKVASQLDHELTEIMDIIVGVKFDDLPVLDSNDLGLEP